MSEQQNENAPWKSKAEALENAGRCDTVADKAWDSALEWAAKKLEEVGCTCEPEDEEDERHYLACPVALAVLIRKGQR